MISDDDEQDLCKFCDSIANHNSNPRARRQCFWNITIHTSRNMPQSHRNSYLDISPLGIYLVHLPSSPLQLRPVFTEQLFDWPPNPSEIDHFAPTVILEPPRKVFPSLGDIAAASLLSVIGEDLQSVPSGSLFITVFCFIRHFYCPLCSDYMISLVATASARSLGRLTKDDSHLSQDLQMSFSHNLRTPHEICAVSWV